MPSILLSLRVPAARLCGLIAFFVLTSNMLAAQQCSKSLDPSDASAWTQASFWKTLDGKPVEQNWQFDDGEVQLANPRGGNGSILSPELPAEFELSWQWKIEPGANTGLKYRVRQYGNRYLGIEYQIIDDDQRVASGAATRDDSSATASIYDLVGPKADKPASPPGQWNEAKVVAVDNRLEHYLNGERVSETRLDGPLWTRHLALSKFWGADGFGQPEGPNRIMLTDHGGRAAYRNFRFVAHTTDEAAADPQADDDAQVNADQANGPYLGNGIRNSWADQDSIVLWTRTTRHPEMKADGIRFISLDRKAASDLAKKTDPDELNAAQLPEGAKLEEMFGACPGAPGEVRLTYFPAKKRKLIKSTEWTKTGEVSDFTAQWKLQDLQPGEDYAAVIEARPIDGDQPTAVIRGRFRTAPKADETAALDFCVTTCHDFIRRDDGMKGHRIYPTMIEMDPDFIVHAGDIEYYDKPDPWAVTKDLMRFKWGRIFSLPNNRTFYQNTTSYFIKDDHDTLKNDCWPGETYGSVTFEEGVQLFNEEQFPSHPTRYETVHWGKDVQIWILEGRDYRSPNNMPDGPVKSILGKEQKEWLLQTLSASEATFKLVFSPTPIVGPDRDNKKDNHANTIFAYEGQQLREAFAKTPGVIVFCGDRHWQYASVDEVTGLWEFGCGPGSEDHELGWKKGDQRPVHRFLRVAGGFLSGHLQYKDGKPKLVLNHRTVDGEEVSEFAFPEE